MSVRSWWSTTGRHRLNVEGLSELLTVLLLVVAMVATPFFAYDAIRDGRRLDAVGQPASAVVVEAYSGRRDPWARLDIEFMASERRVTASVTGEFFEDYEPGRRVAVEYDPQQPSSARLADSRAELWSSVAFALAVGPFVLLFGGVWLTYHLLNKVRPVRGRHTKPRG